MINVNKFISSSGFCSRRQADRLVKDNRVKINGRVAIAIDKISSTDEVTVDKHNIPHTKPQHIYLAFNKPLGVISTSDKLSPNNIMDYIKIPERVFPIGRLDVKSEGLILLTNDGELTQKILKDKVIEKEYEVNVDKTIDDNFLNKLRTGVMIDGRMTLPAKVIEISERSFRIIIVEGRKRQVRRMCEKFNLNVTKLVRVRIGGIELKDIPVGKYKEIRPEEIDPSFKN